MVVYTDNSGRVNILAYGSYKSKSEVHFVLGAETYGFADCFHVVFLIRDELEKVLGHCISVSILTDFASLLNVIIRSSRTSEKRLTIDLVATKEFYDNREIDDIGWIPSSINIADAFTKMEYNKCLDELMDTGIFSQEVSQCEIRKRTDIDADMK